ncbi:acyl-CoA N-acyltransferase [Mycotypha africana]|uniref:acyl-CoA N-acyltransferase n=1 Tax=Mycotypha africana TaxID=64632 RepID=UPI002301E0FB|nr:acyl-CoA N-acyltransferase [Mycotypha africana]KAI8973548.1 acyl-CoA N-acyltransferase [Mycotypha africana]
MSLSSVIKFPTVSFNPQPQITLCNVTLENLSDLINLHTRVFPVHYGENFYDEVLHSGDLSRLIYYNGEHAGAICCRLELTPYAKYTGRIYMMTLAIDPKFRNNGLGSILIQYIMDVARKISSPIVTSLYLHVQTINDLAIRFYAKNGFRVQSMVSDYYRLNENRDAYILVRPVFH